MPEQIPPSSARQVGDQDARAVSRVFPYLVQARRNLLRPVRLPQRSDACQYAAAVARYQVAKRTRLLSMLLVKCTLSVFTRVARKTVCSVKTGSGADAGGRGCTTGAGAFGQYNRLFCVFGACVCCDFDLIGLHSSTRNDGLVTWSLAYIQGRGFTKQRENCA